MSQFIPAFHFRPAEKKLTKEWCNDVIGHYVYQNHLINLLDGKNVEDIEGYATGKFDLKPFKKMFKSLRSQMAQQGNPNIPKDTIDNMDKTGIQWERLALIPPKLNSAIATLQKIPVEITATCVDPLAQKKKDEDLKFLRNKPLMEDALQPLYDSLNLGAVDMGATKHSSIPFTSLPLDLDIDDDDEFRMFANLIYNLAPESAFEVILQKFGEIKKLDQIDLLQIRDHYYYGVSAQRVFGNKMTGLPDAEYIYPGNVLTDGSELPDYSNNIIRIIPKIITPLEIFNYFPDEICDEKQLNEIISGGVSNFNGWETAGYCHCNNLSNVKRSNWGTFKMQLDYVEVKSIDYAMVAEKPKSGYKYFTDDEKKCSGKVWGQNTYCFYWLRNTKHFFGIDRLGFAHRERGNETFSTFSTSIYKSQERSAVELSIGENKKAQIADIKLQHNIVMSTPEGKIIDLKYIRGVVDGLSNESDQYTEKELIDSALEKNIHIIDSEGMEGKQVGQFVPVKDLPGGLKNNIEGYYRVILEANRNIDMFTSINPQLTGQAANPEGLVGLQKLLVNASMNGLYYVNVAMLAQRTNMYNIMAYYIKDAIDKGGKPRKYIESIIGTNKAELIDGMDEVPNHQVLMKITLGQREEERAQFKMEVERLHQKGLIDTAGKYYILNTANPKDAMLLAAMFERKAMKRLDIQRQQQNEAQQQIVEQQGQNVIANTQQQNQGKIELINANKEAQAQLMQLGAQLGLNERQVEGLIKRALQQDRLRGQGENKLKAEYAKINAEQQTALI